MAISIACPAATVLRASSSSCSSRAILAAAALSDVMKAPGCPLGIDAESLCPGPLAPLARSALWDATVAAAAEVTTLDAVEPFALRSASWRTDARSRSHAAAAVSAALAASTRAAASAAPSSATRALSDLTASRASASSSRTAAIAVALVVAAASSSCARSASPSLCATVVAVTAAPSAELCAARARALRRKSCDRGENEQESACHRLNSRGATRSRARNHYARTACARARTSPVPVESSASRLSAT